MRRFFGCLILLGAAMLLSGCAERYYGPNYRDHDGYYRGDRYDYHHHHDRWHDDDYRRDRH